jgi:hypothetical protein
MNRTARCLCGELSVEVSGEPKVCLVCHCTNCQRRTGSVFGAGAYFANEQIISKQGQPKKFDLNTDSGKSLTSHFCGQCGSTHYLEAEMFPGMVGIPVGCFTDPDFPEPRLSVWNQSKYHWVSLPDGWHHLQQQGPENN